ncbi:hypothetical protein [Prochlorococcus marinus]|uniref:hypothetical protein n=1 Tax=Prochlorococcus marinus TaxID=1219 RepID=UPI0022B36577|nr:hypothetical protein [Prochlorococcus marinus]
MKRLLLPLLAALTLPTAVSATNYIECEAIYSAMERISNEYLEAESEKIRNGLMKQVRRMSKDAERRGCWYIPRY